MALGSILCIARVAASVLSLLLCGFAGAQREPESGPPEPAPATDFRLHVYANLVQVPTLVLSSGGKAVPPVTREGFNISLDSGRLFHPTQMRLQGNDPIALGVLLDAGGGQEKLLAAVREALPRFAQRQLRYGDSITLYALDCKIVHNLDGAPPQRAVIQDGLEHLLAAPGLHGGKGKPACGESLRLWDAIVYTANALGKLPGRRILLVVSSGNEASSTIKFARTAEFLTGNAIALFGLRDPEEYQEPLGLQSSFGRGVGSIPMAVPGAISARDGDPFELLCGGNGGLVIKSNPQNIDQKLSDLAELLRGRYILEFPRPDTGDPGVHLISVTVSGKRNYLIRSTGVSVMMPDPSLLNDPNTLHSQPSPATFGPRKALPHS